MNPDDVRGEGVVLHAKQGAVSSYKPSLKPNCKAHVALLRYHRTVLLTLQTDMPGHPAHQLVDLTSAFLAHTVAVRQVGCHRGPFECTADLLVVERTLNPSVGMMGVGESAWEMEIGGEWETEGKGVGWGRGVGEEWKVGLSNRTVSSFARCRTADAQVVTVKQC